MSRGLHTNDSEIFDFRQNYFEFFLTKTCFSGIFSSLNSNFDLMLIKNGRLVNRLILVNLKL